jgi:hypothetical protein
MRLLLLISASLVLARQAACAQSAEDFFNRGAHSYISNNIPQALVSVETGLKQYPDDVKLKKLYELLKQQSQQQSQSNQSRQNQNQQSQPQQSQKNRQNQQPSQQNQSGQKGMDRQNQGQSQASQKKPGADKQENQKESGQPVSAGQMTPEAAKRLLDAQKGDEQFLQMKPPGKPQNNQEPVKDW